MGVSIFINRSQILWYSKWQCPCVAEGSNLIFRYQFMVWTLVPVCTSEILRIFWVGNITLYFAHTVSPRCLVHFIPTLPVTGQFLTTLCSLTINLPSFITWGSLYPSYLLGDQSTSISFICSCIICCFIVGVMPEVVACTHVWYQPFCQSMHIFHQTDQLVAQSQRVIRILLR